MSSMMRVFNKDSIQFDDIAIPPKNSFVIITNYSLGLTDDMNLSVARVEL